MGLSRAQAAQAAAALQAKQQELQATLTAMREAKQERDAEALSKQDAMLQASTAS